MEKKLSESALKGDVVLLTEVLRQDPLILDRTIVSCVSDTPLHTAAMLGHLSFVEALLSHKPELASESDSHGCSPLHLASAKGHLEIVRKLLAADPRTAEERNFDGRTAAHVAAVKGRVEVLVELARVVPESTRALTDRGETALHLCVKHNRLEASKLLAGMDSELVNWKDFDGNTVLHIAVSKKQIETLRFLLSVNGIEVNALNLNNVTALDVLKHSPRDLVDMEIEDLLDSAGALRSRDLHIITHEWVPPKPPPMTKRLTPQEMIAKEPLLVKPKHHDWLGRTRSALMVVASLIATVAFQAGLTPPGGVWQDDLVVDSNGQPVDNPHTVGTSVMSADKLVYGQFMIFNTIAFLASLSIILLLVSGLPMKRRRWTWVQMVVTWIAITAQVVTYFLSIRQMSPDIDAKSTLRRVTEISVLTWLTLMGVVFIGNVIRMNIWILRKRGYVKEKLRRPSAEINDDNDEDEI